MRFLLVTFLSLLLNSNSVAMDLPPLHAGINDLAGMFPPASLEDLQQRLYRFKTETANSVAILTVKSLGDDDIETLTRKAFNQLPLSQNELKKTVLFVVARKEKQEAFHAGSELEPLLPPREVTRKLHAQVALYYDGLRPDLGIHGAVHYLFRVIRGDIRVGSQTDEEKMEETSLRGREAGAIFALCLGPFLAFFAGGLWGIYATQYGVQRWTRLLMGAIFGGGTAKLVSVLTSFLGSSSEGLWYFIMALAIPLGIFGSLTEFWMSGDWRGIPRVKERQRKPEDKMGI